MKTTMNTIYVMLASLALACFALSPRAQALLPPPAPDGGYPAGNTAEGTNALFNLTSGIHNTALGFQALFHNTTGNFNTAEGLQALFANTTGSQNTATGVNALFSNTTGNFNTANGVNALNHNINGVNNTATGVNALISNTTGNFNTANGGNALNHNINGVSNTATGVNALFSNTTGNFNTANGVNALNRNINGVSNTATGVNALKSNTTGNANTANGVNALKANTSTESNVAVGDSALANFNGTTGTDGANTALGSAALNALTSGQENVVVGRRALEFATSGSNNVIVGWRAGDGLTTGSFNTFVGDRAGNNEGPDVDNVICLGTFGDTQAAGQVTPNRCFIGHIVGVTTGGPAPSVPVVIDQDGQLGTVASSRQFKQDIKPLDQASESILKLKPVAFHYKNRDVKNDLTPQFGLIAEDVEQVNRDLVVYGKDSKLWTVRYDAVNVMLLNEFLKAHRKVQELEANVARQQKQIEVLTAGLQKVSAQLELSKPAPQTVLNDQ